MEEKTEVMATVYYYAYVNTEDIVESVFAMPAPIISSSYISIPKYDETLVGKRYNRATGEFEEVTFFYYVVLNGKDIVTEVLRRENQVPDPLPDYMIQITSYNEGLVGKWYNRKDGTFSEPPIHIIADLSTDKINVGSQDVWLTDKLMQTDTTLQGMAEQNQEMAAHVGKRDNPHAVTAQQVGADPLGSAAAVQDYLLTHISDTNIHTKKSVLINANLSANAWTGSKAPYCYSFENPNITATCPVELLKGSSMMEEELEVLQAANIQGGTQTNGSIQLLAYGTKPMQNLTALFLIRGDL